MLCKTSSASWKSLLYFLLSLLSIILKSFLVKPAYYSCLEPFLILCKSGYFFEDWVTDLKTMTVEKINAQSTVITFARVDDHLFKNIYIGALWKQTNLSCNTSSTKKNLLHQSENFVRGEHDPDHLLSDLKFQHWRICFIDLFISFEFPTIKTLSFVGAKWSKMSTRWECIISNEWQVTARKREIVKAKLLMREKIPEWINIPFNVCSGVQSIAHLNAQIQLCWKNYVCGFSESEGLSNDQTTPWIQNFASKFFQSS